MPTMAAKPMLTQPPNCAFAAAPWNVDTPGELAGDADDAGSSALSVLEEPDVSDELDEDEGEGWALDVVAVIPGPFESTVNLAEKFDESGFCDTISIV